MRRVCVFAYVGIGGSFPSVSRDGSLPREMENEKNRESKRERERGNNIVDPNREARKDGAKERVGEGRRVAPYLSCTPN